MSDLDKRGIFFITIADLLIALFAFCFARYFTEIPNRYWFVLSAFIWVFIGTITNKLYFSKYKKRRFAFGALFFVDLITGSLLYFSYKNLIVDYKFDFSIIYATAIIFLLECLLYSLIDRFVYRKIPYFYEENPISDDVEHITASVSDGNVENEAASSLIEALEGGVVDALAHFQGSDKVVVLDTSNPEEVLQSEERYPSLIIHSKLLNCIRHINTLFAYTNYKLDDGGYIACRCVTSGIRRDHIMNLNPRVINMTMCLIDYFFHRMCPKLPFVKNIYYFLTKGERRALTRVEVLGRLYRAGFEVVCEKIVAGEFYCVARKIKEPIRNDNPSNGVLIRLRRRGKGGKFIGVYKFRTMHAYSEYLQPYIYKTEGLAEGGKFAADYRVSSIGKFLRKTWLDEFPMFINLAKGNLKLVGVRPLSNHYFSLYSKELQELRIKVKPGLLPPFYADMPKTLDEIQASEIRYIKSYLKNPIVTDICYIIKIFQNIVLRGKRSK